VATSVREGWGLVVTEAAEAGIATIGYDVPGLRDSIVASGGVLTQADPTSLALGLVRMLSPVAGAGGPRAEPAGVVPWKEVAAAIFAVAKEARPPVMGTADRVADRHGPHRTAVVDRIARAPLEARPYVPRQSVPGGRREEVLEG
jgi:hypothetical protein